MNTNPVVAQTASNEETEALGARLGATLAGGEVILLYGDLGTGKTVFVRGLARGMGLDPEEVASPTFTLMTTYKGKIPLHHADLYRLRGGGDEQELGLEELPGPRGVLAIEWAERLGSEPWTRKVRVRLSHAGEDLRRVEIETEGA